MSLKALEISLVSPSYPRNAISFRMYTESHWCKNPMVNHILPVTNNRFVSNYCETVYVCLLCKVIILFQKFAIVCILSVYACFMEILKLKITKYKLDCFSISSHLYAIYVLFCEQNCCENHDFVSSILNVWSCVHMTLRLIWQCLQTAGPCVPRVY